MGSLFAPLFHILQKLKKPLLATSSLFCLQSLFSYPSFAAQFATDFPPVKFGLFEIVYQAIFDFAKGSSMNLQSSPACAFSIMMITLAIKMIEFPFFYKFKKSEAIWRNNVSALTKRQIESGLPFYKMIAQTNEPLNDKIDKEMIE